jgi:hypothetical protein
VISTKKKNPANETTPITSKDFTSVVNKMYDVKSKVTNNNVSRSFKDKADIQQLQRSDWFKSVQTDIENRRYFVIAEKKNAKSFFSFNDAQNLEAHYGPEKFMLEPFAASDNKEQANRNKWQLNILVNGIYADNRLLKNFNTGAVANTGSTNDIEYNFSDIYCIQYHNDSTGVRQNFIIRKKPSGPVNSLKIRMRADGDWVVNKAHDKELHFAKLNSKRTLDNKVVYNDLRAWDANGKSLAAKMEVSDKNNFEIITNVENAVYPVTIDPLSTSASTTLSGGGTFGNSVASAGDVNGDGYTDVIVGDASSGTAYIYLGTASGLSSSSATTLTGTGNFGTSVATAGDVNGDGYSDVIVGDPAALSGNAYVYLGSSSGVSTSPATTLSGSGAYGVSVATAGDVNGDGYSDVVVGNGLGGAFVYPGSSTGLSLTGTTLTGSGTNFGASVATAGDVDGDGYSDVIAGNAGGSAFLYKGSGSGISTSAAVTLTEAGAGANYGVSVASAADINGDGYSDVIVGDGAGNAYIYLGSSSGLSSSSATALTGSGSFGISVSGAGDVNGDAFADVIIGDNNGNAFVFNGSATGITSGSSATASTTLTGSGNFGISTASAGDVNGDGYSDVIVGSSNTSSAYTYTGSPDGSTSTNTLSILGTLAGDRFALSVSSAGDINGDGYSDVIVGTIGYSGGALNGAAYIYLGSATGLSAGSPIILTPGSYEVGWDVASAGDIDGDGYGDILVGAKYTTVSGGIDQGEVYVYRGNSSGVPTLAATLTGLAQEDVFGFSVSTAGDINGDGYSDIIIGAPGVSTVNSLGGATYIYMGGPYDNASSSFPSFATPVTLNGPNVNAAFGVSVASAGDVNGDGYSDVIVGAPNLGNSYDIPGVGGRNSGSGIGVAYIFYGSQTSIANNATPDVTLSDNTTVDFGVSVSSAGDVNGDGYSDIVVGASSGDNASNNGTAELFLGGPGGTSSSAATILNGSNPGDEFGSTVASAGDVNGDGYSDIIVRATQPSSGNPSTGASYIFLGSPSGLSSTADITFSDEGSNTYLETPAGGANGNILHRAVASVGDVNGDGYSDVIIGQYTDNANGVKAGKAYLYYGNNSAGHNASNVLKLYESDFSGPITANNLTHSDFGLGLFAQSPFGSVKGKLVWETEANGTAFQGNPITNNVTTTGSQSSYSTIPAGGTEFTNVIQKSPAKATKVRVRIRYAPTATTFGQVYGPWINSQAYLLGINPGILPLDLLAFTATPVANNIVLNWKASGENDLSKYVVEHSTDALAFDSLGYVTSKGTTGTSSYDFTHYQPSVGIHYYRLREVNRDGKIAYSKTVFAKITGPGKVFSIYPNPASDHITIIHAGITSNTVRIINAAGAVIGQYQLNQNADQTTLSLDGYAKGNYFVELVNSGFAPKQITVK